MAWVNAHVHVVVPLDVPVDSTNVVKLVEAEAFAEALDMESVDPRATYSLRVEDVDGEPSTVDPDTVKQIVDWLRVQENNFYAKPRDWALIAAEIEKEFM